MTGNSIASGASVEFRGQLDGGVGGKFLAWLLTFLLAFPAWIFVPAVEAALLDDTVNHLPVDLDDSYDVTVGDVNGDNYPDLINSNRGRSRLLINDQSGAFIDETDARVPFFLQTTIATVMGDVDADGDQDAMLVGSGRNRLLINDGSGNFSDESNSQMPATVSFSMDVALADVDNDGDLDAVIANRGSQNSLLINDGAGNFSDQSATRLPADSDKSYAVVLRDVDGDGRPDIFFANQSARNRMLINNQLGVFNDTTATALPDVVDSSNDAELADVDKDGDNDLIIAQGSSGVSMLLNDGSGIFTPAPAGQLPPLSDFAIKLVVGDINFDGALDIIVGNSGQDRLLLNDGSGTFTDATGSELPLDETRTFGLALLDADRDLDLDLVAATPQGQNRYYDNALLFPRILIDVSPDYIEVTDTVNIGVTVFDEDGVASTQVDVIEPDLNVVPAVSAGPDAWTFVPSKIGIHNVRVTAIDNLSNPGVKLESFNAQANDILSPLVTLNITPTTVTQGESIALHVTATDDRGVVSRAVSVDGVNVPLDGTGSATYIPLTVGTLPVLATALDAAGNLGTDSGTVEVLPDLVPPQVNLAATPDPVDITNPIAVSASASDNIAVASFAVTVTGPAGGPVDQPITLDAGGNGSYTPYIPGTYTFTATATDPAGNSQIGTVNVVAQGIPDTEAPQVTLSVVPPTTIPGGTVTLTVNASDNIFVLTRTLEINGTPVALDSNHQAQFTAPALGSYTAIATATDPTGNLGSDTVVFNAVDPATDTDPPVVAITDPPQGGDLEGQAEIIGTANDLTLVSYELAYAPTGSNAFTTFATGSVPVINGLLGTLDTSLLENGLYDIRLSAIDINGRSSSVVQTYTAQSEFKAGIFTISYTDLQLPLAGLPVTIKRNYDSRRRNLRQDFGQGWELEVISSGNYMNNRELGDGWTGLSGGLFGGIPCQGGVREDLFHITEVRFSDTEFYKFAFQVNLTGAFASTGCEVASVEFIQVGGIPGAQLEPLDNGGSPWLWVQGGQLYDLDTFVTYDPEDVRLTTLDGREYDLNLSTGVTRIGDQNGNSLFINNNGVVHSSGASIGFTRDGLGRITRITDPAGKAINYTYDTAGDLTAVADRNNSTTTFFYVADHYLDRIEDPLGNTPMRNEYDANGRLIAQLDGAGNRTDFSYDVENGTQQTTDREGNVKVLQYTEEGRLASANINGATSSYTYDTRGNKLTETDPNGNTRTFTYNAKDQMTSETDALGNVYTYQYDAQGRFSKLEDNGGSELNFTYDANGNPTEQRDANGTLMQGFAYDSTGNVTQVATAAGNTNLTYDASGNRLTSIVLPNGLTRSFSYDSLGRKTSESVTRTVGGTPTVETINYTYDGNGNLLTRTDPRGGSTTWTYDANNRKATQTDARGNTQSFVYDNRGLITRINYPDSTFELFGYDLEGRKTARTDRAGRTMFWEYDAQDRITRIIHPDGAQQNSTYDAAGNLITSSDPLGNTTSYTHDALKRVTRVTDPLGNHTDRTYTNDQVRPTTLTDGNGNLKTFSYDTSHFLAEELIETELPDSTTLQQSYAPGAHRVATRTDAAGNSTSYSYDGRGNLLTVTDAAGQVTSYTYDEVGNRLTQTDANGHATTFTYDANGNLLTKTLPGGQTASWSYDLENNVVSQVDFNGQTTTYAYDSMNRLTTRTLPGGAVESFTYTPTGQIATAVNPTGTISFGYDARDRLLSVTYPGGITVDYTYDLAGNRTSLTSALGTTNYTYDAANRLASVTDPDSRVTSYGYDAVGNITQITYPNGTAATLAYDVNDRTVQVTHSKGATVLADFQYDLDANGNRIRMIEAAGRQVDYAYDALQRLTQESEAGVTTSYNYDAVGNIQLISDTSGGNLTASYDTNDRILTVGTRSFGFDANGNLTSITDGSDVTQFQYDARNRLIQRIAADGTVAQYSYDALGNRISRTLAGSTNNYIIDPADNSGLAQVLYETNASGVPQMSYVYGHDLLSSKNGGATSFLHTDALGSTRLLTDAAGNATDSYAYDAYGLQLSATGSTPNNNRFAGEQLDPDTGLYYLRARWYDPEIARFITRDPFAGDIEQPLTLNPYLYANANPVNMIDPTGEFSLISVSISVAIVGILASIAYTQVYKPAKDVYDKVVELVRDIPNMRLNDNAERDELGFTAASVQAALDQEDITAVVTLGGGAVEKAYSVVYKMSTTFGQVVALIHAWNSATWMKYLPMHDGKPAHYVSCGFNHYVQKTYSLGLLTGMAAAKRFQATANIIAAYLAYYTFLALVIDTAEAFVGGGDLLQPTDDPDNNGPACPGPGLN
ncbi:MAG: VCBS repeat-containing protein [Chromatiaceae bacterium]|nr:VCBS repeat-containing protein [Chromatiaceae bacterium]